MSKKKKNKRNERDYFDISVEEQMANANALHACKKGEISFLDVLGYKVPTKSTKQSSYKKQLEEYVETIMNCDNEHIERNINDISYNIREEYIDNGDIELEDSVIIEQFEVQDEEPKDTYVEPKSYNNIPRITFHYNEIIGKMFVNDGYVATPITVCSTSSIEIDSDNIPKDSEAFGSLLSKIFFYIISCKHPSVIMTEEDFKTQFSIFSKINFNRFIFFKNNGFVYAYVLEEGESNNFYSVIDIFNMNDEYILKYVVGSAYACNTMHNIFMYNDEDEVESVMTVRNSVKDLIKLIEDDKETEYAGHNMNRDVMSCMQVNDLKKFVADIYSTLDDLIVADDDDYDDDDDDDSDYDITVREENSDEVVENDEDIDIDDFPYDDNSSDIEEMIDSFDDEDDDDENDDDDDEKSVIIPKIYHR